MTSRTRGFTIVELLVAMAILVVTLVAVVEVFNISSETASRTAAHAEVIAASAALQQRLTDLLSKIAPGMLIIDSPNPTGLTELRADFPEGSRYFRLRHDRLVFVASGGPDEFQSFTDPRRGQPVDDSATSEVDETTLVPASSSQALIYFGPGIPLTNTGDPRQTLPFDDRLDYKLSGAQWIFAHRAILFLLDPPTPAVPGWVPADMRVFTDPGMIFHGGHFWWPPPNPDMTPSDPALKPYVSGAMDAVVSSDTHRADATTFIELFGELPISNLLLADPDAQALWEPNWCPTTVSLVDPAVLDYGDHYTRTGFTFLPRLADFRIEWTDGRLDPDGNTRWFGLQVDQNSISRPTDLKYFPAMRQDFSGDTTAAERVAFGIDCGVNGVEWAKNAAPCTPGAPAADNAYRAVWRQDTWQFRPKALRFTYRIYDSGSRLKNQKTFYADEYGGSDPPAGSDPVAITRYGQDFTIVVPLP